MSSTTGQPHGPNLRLTFKRGGKTVTESVSDPVAKGKAEREIAEFRKLQVLHKAFVDVNARICRLRPARAEMQSPEKKNGRDDPARSDQRNSSFAPDGFPGSQQDRARGSGGYRNGDAISPASRGGHRVDRIDAIHAPCRRLTRTSMLLRQARSLPRTPFQNDSHRCRRGRGIQAVLPVSGLSLRPVS